MFKLLEGAVVESGYHSGIQSFPVGIEQTETPRLGITGSETVAETLCLYFGKLRFRTSDVDFCIFHFFAKNPCQKKLGILGVADDGGNSVITARQGVQTYFFKFLSLALDGIDICLVDIDTYKDIFAGTDSGDGHEYLAVGRNLTFVDVVKRQDEVVGGISQYCIDGLHSHAEASGAETGKIYFQRLAGGGYATHCFAAVAALSAQRPVNRNAHFLAVGIVSLEIDSCGSGCFNRSLRSGNFKNIRFASCKAFRCLGSGTVSCRDDDTCREIGVGFSVVEGLSENIGRDIEGKGAGSVCLSIQSA